MNAITFLAFSSIPPSLHLEVSPLANTHNMDKEFQTSYA